MSEVFFRYDPVNRELSAVVDRFADADEAVDNIVLRPGVAPGSRIAAGAPLAELEWSDGSRTTVHAPAGCEGVIDFLNHRAEDERLDRHPAKVLLRLRRS